MDQNDTQKKKRTIKAKIRLDYQAIPAPKRFWAVRKNTQEISEEIRDQQVLGLQNLAFQGIRIEEVDRSGDVYNVKDPVTGEDMSFAPTVVSLEADCLEDLMEFSIRDEFRKVDIISPELICLDDKEIGRLISTVNRKMRENKLLISRLMEKT